LTMCYVAKVQGADMVYFSGFAPGGRVSTSDRAHAVPFVQSGTADAFRAKLNEKEDSPCWFTVRISEEGA